MKNIVKCPRGFFAYFNALETYSELQEKSEIQQIFQKISQFY